MNNCELAVDVNDLSVRFGNFVAVDNISFQVSKGEIFGFLGANGAGKTTTIRVLCGLLLPSDGNATVGGFNIYDSEYRIKSIVGYMSQKFTLYDDLSVDENLNFIASLRKLEPIKYQRRRKELFEFVSFDKSVHTLVGDLPPGSKQHVSLAASLLHDPEIVFLDEPTAGVSPQSRALFWSLIKKLSASKKTVFVTTHYMDEAEQCQRIALMRDGKIVALDKPSELKLKIFPNQMYEFDPIIPLSFNEMLEIAKDPVFEYFEPYGLRFHASLKFLTFAEAEAMFKARFRIAPIKPSLEDVFIRTVEAGGE